HIQYDTTLPSQHNYLGDNLNELSGRVVLDETSTVNIPLLTIENVVLVPSQVLPLQIHHPTIVSMMRRLVDGQRTVGVVASLEPTLGTTAEIRSYSGDSDDDGEGLPVFRLKAEGRQRFRVMETWRQDGVVMGKIHREQPVLPMASPLQPLHNLSLHTPTGLNPKVSGSGVFEFRLMSFINDLSRDAVGNCCHSSAVQSGDNNGPNAGQQCSEKCQTFFRVCLKHYQTNIDPSPPCTYGEVITPVFNASTVYVSHQNAPTLVDDDHTIRFPFNFSWPVSGSGVFEFRLMSFINDLSRDAVGNCCHSSTVQSGDNNGPNAGQQQCSEKCQTFFRVCLKHYQTNIDPSPPCTYGEVITPVFNASTVYVSHQNAPTLVDDDHTIRFPFNFSWPGTFSLIVEAWHNASSSPSSLSASSRAVQYMASGVRKKAIANSHTAGGCAPVMALIQSFRL
ncbi:unnamed protein product, partial [Medioppia subpectinata]